MATTAPMRGKRVRAVRCYVSGHGYGKCDMAMSGPPLTRHDERLLVERDVDEWVEG